MRTEELKYSLMNLMHRKTRSMLTVLSIVIGMMAVFALVSFGLGIQRYVDELKNTAGADKLYVQAKGTGAPGTDLNFYISKDDANFIEKIKGVSEIVSMYAKPAEIFFKDQKRYTYLISMDPKKIDFIMETSNNIKVIKGRQLKNGDIDKAVIGYNFLFDNKVFKKALNLGDKILVNGKNFQIIGFVSEVGNPQDDAQIYITNEAFETLHPEYKDKFSYSIIKSEKGVDPQELADKITEKLRKFKNQKEGQEDFFVMTFADAIAIFGNIINIINSVLFLIAFVSVIVASVNIMNTMYTAVLERTQEIGVMKAIGARNSDIRTIFLFESGFLGMIGGILGVFLGYLVASTGGLIAASSGYASLRPIFPVTLILGCIFFAVLIGGLSGLFPAIQASKLKPVEALRYE